MVTMMKRMLVICLAIFILYSIALAGGPPVTQSSDWTYIINNAYRTADEYAVAHNPSATFICPKKQYDFVKQLAGRYKGKYLLLIKCEHSGNISYAALLATFDVNTSASKLNDEDPNLWKIVNAKLNGKEF